MNRGVYISIYVYIWIHVKTCIINASTLSLISLTYRVTLYITIDSVQR